MKIEKNQIFNLMDTNGRRSDVLNALKVYLEILEDLKSEYPGETWNTYPAGIAQFLFYEKALEKSKDVFKKHDSYDRFMEELGTQYQAFIEKDAVWIREHFPAMSKTLDDSIEKRARHYTSNLVKIGFTNGSRNITESGYSYLRGKVSRDSIEDILPLDDINIILLRQLSKLKIFSVPDPEGNRQFYSPFLMALVLLLGEENVSRHTFETIVQGLTPYTDKALKKLIRETPIDIERLEAAIQSKTVEVPQELLDNTDFHSDVLKAYFKSSKNNITTTQIYYDFIILLKEFRENKCQETYDKLVKCLEKNGTILQKAFGYGKLIFNVGNRNSRYDLKTFMEKNSDHPLLTADDYIREVYITFSNSKWIDGVKEYSDTTVRLLSATGLFKFKNLPDLAYKEILSLIFNIDTLKNNIFGQMTEEEYCSYELSEDCYLGKNISMVKIFHVSQEQTNQIVEKIEAHLGVISSHTAKLSLQNKKSSDFICHIQNKYPKEKIKELLPLFSDRKNDYKIKKAVNDTASVPTIYEYIIGIAWYYISNKTFDLYNSLNLTLDADFEPVIHAGGGTGDIVINYDDIIVMLEVTLMNKQAQKRGEWEPVLRHSLNLKAENEPKETVTFFIADELDYNTINIWRAVASVSLESTNTHILVDGVMIMPLTNQIILSFLEKGISHTTIIQQVKDSFKEIPKLTDVTWHDDAIISLLGEVS